MSEWLENDLAEVKKQLKKKFNYTPNTKQGQIQKKLHTYVYCICSLAFEISKKDSERMEFLKEMHSDFVHLQVSLPLGLKKSSFLSLRAGIEHTLMHIYYKDHPIELQLLNESPENKTTTEFLFKYLNTHPKFKNEKIKPLIEKIHEHYSKLSKTIHGTSTAYFQQHKTISEIQISDAEFDNIVKDVKILIDSLMTIIIIFHRSIFRTIHHEHTNLIMTYISNENKTRINS